jgi:hypothetical protein
MNKPLIGIIWLYLILETCALNGQNTWRHRACIPSDGRWSLATFSIANKGYALGGATTGTAALAELWEYDPTIDRWTQKNNFPHTITGGTAFVINDTAYVCLGQDVNLGFSVSCYRYETATDSWKPMANFPGAARYGAMAFVINGKAYVGCGFNGNTLQDFYQYDPSTNQWSSKASFPGAVRQNGFGAAIGGLGYMGLGGNPSPLNDSYKYNAATNSWSSIADLPGDAPNNPGYFVINDTLYIAGGYLYGDTEYSYCWRYNAVPNTWTAQPGFGCIAPPRFFQQGFTIHNHGYVQFGADHTYTKAYRDMLEFGPLDTAFARQVSVLGQDSLYHGNFTRILSTGDSCTVWSTGAIGASITVTASGTYAAYFSDSCGMLTDKINLTISGIKDIAGADVRLYPDPLTSGSCHLTVPDACKGKELEIFDINGKQVCRRLIENGSLEIPFDFTAGVYLLRINMPGEAIIRRIVRL